jgi:hypothetical protein
MEFPLGLLIVARIAAESQGMPGPSSDKSEGQALKKLLTQIGVSEKSPSVRTMTIETHHAAIAEAVSPFINPFQVMKDAGAE